VLGLDRADGDTVATGALIVGELDVGPLVNGKAVILVLADIAGDDHMVCRDVEAICLCERVYG
jgi:hypothetical protein